MSRWKVKKKLLRSLVEGTIQTVQRLNKVDWLPIVAACFIVFLA